jgi:hypothetical protein
VSMARPARIAVRLLISAGERRCRVSPWNRCKGRQLRLAAFAHARVRAYVFSGFPNTRGLGCLVLVMMKEHAPCPSFEQSSTKSGNEP